MREDTAADESFWDFANRLYSQPELARLCLELQDEYRADVNMVLFCCWHGRSRGALEAEDFNRALAFSRLWQSRAVEPLRALRRLLGRPPKELEPHLAAPSPASDTVPPTAATLREQVLALELQCEHFQENRLETLVESRPTALSARQAWLATAGNLLLYFRSLPGLGAPASGERPVLLKAAEALLKASCPPADAAEAEEALSPLCRHFRRPD